MQWRHLGIGWLVGALLCLSGAAWADITGSISGVVKDSSGGIVPGASVVARNTQTGVAQTLVTNDRGFYNFPTLPIGAYEITVARPGFRDFHQTGLTIDANSALTVDATMEVGAQTQVVEVESSVTHVETQNTQMGEVIHGSTMTEVPLNGRSFTDLLSLQPGVVPYTKAAEGGNATVSGSLNPGNQSVNGQREASNGFMVNGANVNEGEYNGASIIPNLDSISEFRIITSNFNAEYGNYSGGQVNVATKSGTNQVHGDAFEFLRNTDLNARNFYSPTIGKFIQNQFGGIIGGPIKHDKAFFFADYQGTRQIQGVAENLPVPSPAERAGDFSAVASKLTGTVNGGYWANTLSQQLGYAVAAGERYYTAGCTTTSQCVFPGAIIPQKAWASPAAPLMQYIPAPNAAGNFFTTSAGNLSLGDDKGSIRADVDSRFGRVSSYYLMDNFDLNAPYSGTKLPGFNTITPGRSQLAVLSDTKTLSASALNEFSLSFMRYAQVSNWPSGGVGPKLSSLGFVEGVGTLGIVPVTPSLEGVPSVSFQSFSMGLGQASGRFDNTYQLSDNFSKIIGTHSLRFGGSVHYDQINDRNTPGPASYTFSGSETGIDFADFLIGAPSSFVQSSLQLLDSRSKYVGLYAQDSWRATSNLTLNYGMRWEFSQPWRDTQNKIKTVIVGEQSQLFPGAPRGLVYPGDPGVPSTLAPTKYDAFSPRVGLAYSPNISGGVLGKLLGGPGKTSIRAGFGVFFTAIEDLTLFNLIGGVPYGLFYSAPAPPLFATPYVDRSTGLSRGQRFPYVFPSANVSAQNPDNNINWAQLEPITPTPYFTHNRLPYAEHFELSVQRQFGSGTLLTVAYVGNQAHKLISSLEANPGNAPLCLSLSQTSAVAPGSPTCGPFGENSIYTTASGQVINGTRTVMGPLFTSVTFMDLMANSTYNSAQITLRHTSGRSSFLAGYTFSKSLDNSSALGQIVNPYNFSLSRALSSFDVTNNFVVSYSVQLINRPFGGHSRAGNAALGGWVLSGITNFATGLPVALSESDDRSLLEGSGQGAPDLPNVTSGPILANTDPRSRLPYFNTKLFSAEPLGQIGDTARRFFHGPGINNFNAALLKDFHFTEARMLQLRLEAFNIFNHAQFMNPSGSFNSSAFGLVTAARDPRVAQIAAKLIF